MYNTPSAKRASRSKEGCADTLTAMVHFRPATECSRRAGTRRLSAGKCSCRCVERLAMPRACSMGELTQAVTGSCGLADPSAAVDAQWLIAELDLPSASQTTSETEIRQSRRSWGNKAASSSRHVTSVPPVVPHSGRSKAQVNQEPDRTSIHQKH